MRVAREAEADRERGEVGLAMPQSREHDAESEREPVLV
jgi:hypothetical protein